MTKPLLVVIQGAPATGKTTLSNELSKYLTIPILGKDHIKEFLYDTIPQSDLEFSRIEGMAAYEMLYAFARIFLEQDKSIVIEGAFFTKYTRPALQTILTKTNAQYLEIFCYIDPIMQRERYTKRVHDGTRHSGHLLHGADYLKDNSDYEKLNLGECIEIDTQDSIDQALLDGIILTIQQKLTSDSK